MAPWRRHEDAPKRREHCASDAVWWTDPLDEDGQRSGPLLCTPEKSPCTTAPGPRWEQSAPTGTPRGVSAPASSMEPETQSKATGPLPCGRWGEKPGSVSVYPAEKRVSPGSNYDEVVNICWLNGVLSTRRLQSQPQPWKVPILGIRKGKGGLLTFFRGPCSRLCDPAGVPGFIPPRAGGRVWHYPIAPGRQYQC